jgi:hypothetical protein
MDWDAKRVKAAQMIRRCGAEASLVRVAQTATANPWDPPAQTETTERTRALLLSYEAQAIDGTAILAGDVRAMIPVGSMEPMPGDALDVGAVRFRTVSVQPSQPGGTVLFYYLQLRR